MGYEDAVNLAGGFTDWKRNGFDVTILASLSEQRSRYSRHLLIPEVGEDGQQRSSTRACFWSAQAGLGSPAALYLAAAGVGTRSESWTRTSSTSRTSSVRSSMRRIVWEPKVHSAKRTIEALNPDVLVRRSRSADLRESIGSSAKGGT